MNYPVWDVPYIGSGWVIGLIAITHVFVSHFAIGGGLYLPFAEWKAWREGRTDWREKVKKHTKFFLVLTAAWGTISGVGIWFAIGLGNAEATSTLIHYFVLAWAMEWGFFILEIYAIAVYWYTWDRIPETLHIKVGWFYAFVSFFTLFIINGILTFMLTSGEAFQQAAGSGRETYVILDAFFNPTFWPSLFLRIAACAAMAGVFALFTGSRIDEVTEGKLKGEFVRWSANWILPSFFAMPIGFVWYLSQVPPAHRAHLVNGIATSAPGLFTIPTRMLLLLAIFAVSGILAVIAFCLYQPWRLKFYQAAGICLIAFGIFGATEFGREMLRKPYVIGGHMYSNGVRRADVERLNRQGFLTTAVWAGEAERYLWDRGGDSAAARTARLRRGQLMLLGQCTNCHTLDGYRGLRGLLGERNRDGIDSLLRELHEQPETSKYPAYMPPLVGTDAEIRALADWLEHLLQNNPAVPASATTGP